MNRAREGVFHFAVRSSLTTAVNQMWKVCKSGGKLESGLRCASGSEELGTDFSHEGWGGNTVTTGRLQEISTSAQGLLLLLV